MYSYDLKAEFSAQLLQSSTSHDPSEINMQIWTQDCWKEFKHTIFFSQDYLMNINFKRTAFIWNSNILKHYKSLLINLI